MKKKLISTLILSLLFTFTSTSPALAVNNSNNVLVQENSTSNAEINKSYLDDILSEVNMHAQELTNMPGITSVQYAISDGDTIVSGHTGLAKKEDNIEVNDNTLYGIGSVSKMFTTAAVMQLVDEGKINLDVPLTNYIPEFKMADPRYVKITPRMLLNHSSGLMGKDYSMDILLSDPDTMGHDNFLNNLQNERLKDDPGAYSVYCNDGFTLAEILVEKVSKTSFTNYIKEHFSDPLKLENTKTPLDDFDRDKRMARSYIFSQDKADPVETLMAIGAGGIYSSAEDLCKFLRGITRKDNQGLLKNKSIEAMEEREYLKGLWPVSTNLDDNTFNYGLGWDSVDTFPFNRCVTKDNKKIRVLSKGGDAFEEHAYVISLPDYGLNIAVTSAGGGSNYNGEIARDAIMKILIKKGIITKAPEEVVLNNDPNENLPGNMSKDFNGIYNIYDPQVETGRYEIKFEDNKLNIKDVNDEKNKVEVYRYCAGDGYSYFVEDSDNTPDYCLTFVKDKNGKKYIEKRSYAKVLCAQEAVTHYVGEMIDNQAAFEMNDVWTERTKHRYYQVNNKYSSLLYTVYTPVAQFIPDSLGFIGYNKIIDNNLVKCDISLPVDIGRDSMDYKFTDAKNGEIGEYVDVALGKYLSDKYIKDLEYFKEVTIDDNGYTKWFKVPDDLDGKTITVQSSKQSCFAVYNDTYCLYNSYLNKLEENGDNLIDKITLHKGTMISFTGNPGEKFKVNIE